MFSSFLFYYASNVPAFQVIMTENYGILLQTHISQLGMSDARYKSKSKDQ